METPELDKIAKLHEDSQKIGTFLEWLGEKGYRIGLYGRYTDDDGESEGIEQLIPITKGVEELLADYFEIDLKKAETERRAILEEIRNKG